MQDKLSRIRYLFARVITAKRVVIGKESKLIPDKNE